MKNILVISDFHLPFEIKGALSFLKRVRDKYECKEIVCIGDILDHSAVSYHEEDPDGLSAGREFKLARKKLSRIVEAFPKVKVCIGNHDNLIYRKAKTAGLSKHFFKSFNDIYDLPKTWDWQFKHDIGDITFQHGTGASGANAHIKLAKANMRNTVIGHAHSHAGISYIANSEKLIYGMNVGSLIDRKSYAMAYGKDFVYKPIISCGVIQQGIPMIIPMSI